MDHEARGEVEVRRKLRRKLRRDREGGGYLVVKHGERYAERHRLQNQ
jgi:hypothetical protein